MTVQNIIIAGIILPVCSVGWGTAQVQRAHSVCFRRAECAFSVFGEKKV